MLLTSQRHAMGSLPANQLPLESHVEQLSCSEPFDASGFEILVVRPDGNAQVERQRQEVDIIWIAQLHSLAGLEHFAPVDALFDRADRQDRNRQQDGLWFKMLSERQRGCVFTHVVQNVRRGEDNFN